MRGPSARGHLGQQTVLGLLLEAHAHDAALALDDEQAADRAWRDG